MVIDHKNEGIPENRRGKGTHRAIDAAQRYSRCFPYVLQCDIRQFFPSIDHTILRGLLARKVQDPGLLWLIDRIVAGGAGVLAEVYRMVYFPGDDLFAALRPRGLPIGNLTSQFWANVYLNPLDHKIKRELRCRGYVRYVDDLLLFAATKEVLWHWREEIVAFLTTLRLTLHPGAHPRPVSEGFPFLGFVLFPWWKRLKRRKGIEYQRRLAGLVSAWRVGKLSSEALWASVHGWINHCRQAHTAGLFRTVLTGLPRPAGGESVRLWTGRAPAGCRWS